MAADSAISARASAAAAGQDAALAAQAADDAFRIAVEKALAEQAELQAGLDAQAVDGADPENQPRFSTSSKNASVRQPSAFSSTLSASPT